MTMSSIEVVRASSDQFADASSLLNEYFTAINVVQRDTEETIRAALSGAAGTAMWIAYTGGEAAGCVLLRPLTLPQSAECKRLYVRPEHRGNGIAGLLVSEMESFARLSSLDWIYLDSKDDLSTAIALYKQRGYEPCARYNDNPQATIFLRKRLARDSAG